MQNKKSFNELFFKYKPDSGMQKLIDASTDYTYALNKEHRYIKITMTFGKLISRSDIERLERELSAVYELAYCRVFPVYGKELFTQLLASPEGRDAAYREIIAELRRDFAFVNGFFDDSEAVLTETTLDIVLRPGLDKLPRTAECEAETAKTAARLFSCALKVSVSAPELSSEMYEKAMLEFDRSSPFEISAPAEEKKDDPRFLRAALSDEVKNAEVDAENSTVVSGWYTYDISAPEIIYGSKLLPDHTREIFSVGTVPAESEGMTVCATVFFVEAKESRDGSKVTYIIRITDDAGSATVKVRGKTEKLSGLSALKPGSHVLVRGSVGYDEFEKDRVISPKIICVIKRIDKTDDAEEKRVELHLHTQMSAMDATIPPDVIVKTAYKWGHRAVAITDHGNLQAFPEAMIAYEKLGADPEKFKVIYGMEGYFVDDTARASYGAGDADIETGEFCIFDIETTGLSANTCGITEIGAVIYKAGEVADVFNTFVDPGQHIPENITQLTGITDEMVAGAPCEKDAVEAFLKFAGGRILIAHNASFDTGFIRRVCTDNGMPFENSYLDTVALSKFLNPELKRHRLDSLKDHYGLPDFNHHRASDDAEMLAAIFGMMRGQMLKLGIHNLADLAEEMSAACDPKKLPSYHIIILVQNLTGLKNLYRLVSKSYLDYFKRTPRIPKTVLSEYRDGLVIGSACESGELYTAIVDGKPRSELLRIAEFYDYLEVQPLGNNDFLVATNRVESREKIKEFNRTVISLAKEQNKPCVATGDVHFLNPQDEIYRKILLHGMKFSDANRSIPLYFRTTKEMLAEFDYLDPETAYEIVVTNPNKVCDMIENVRPIPKGQYTPELEGSEEELVSTCHNNAKALFGDPLPEIVSSRLEKELGAIVKYGFAVLYVIAKRLVEKSERDGYLVGSRGSVGSSFVATMAGISEVNPLPPFYLCKKCKHSEFITDGSYGSGFDMPTKNCPVCGEVMYQDGHNIPFETFLGFKGDKSPDIDLNFSGDVQAEAHKYTEVLFGKDNVFRAGTLGTLASKTAYGFVMKYLEENGLPQVNKAEVERLINGCVGVKRTTGQHPGGIIVIPRNKDVHDFTPVQHPADDPDSSIVTTHFAFTYLHDTILKLDILGHDVPTKYKLIEQYTGMSVLSVPMNDQNVMGLFLSPEPLGVTKEQIKCETGTLALPEFGTGFTRQMLLDSKPKCFSDLLQISGLSHGTNVWVGNAQDLVRNGVCTISEVVGTRDSIMVYLLQKGLPSAESFKIMEDVRKGRGLKPEYEELMLDHGVPEWYIESCKKIKYMFPKAHAAAYVISAIRLGWFKVYKPLEFYCAYFSAAPDGFDAEIALSGKTNISKLIDELEGKGMDTTQKEDALLAAMRLVLEMLCRGIKILPIDLNKSHAFKFLPEDGCMRLPFSSLSGLGAAAAKSIYDVMSSGKVKSVEDLKTMAGLSRSVVDNLARNKILSTLPETNQLTLFDF